jgi:hypothetical protein
MGVTSVTQTSTTHPLQPQHKVKVSVVLTSNPSLITYIYRTQAFFLRGTTPKCINALQVSPYPPTLNSLKKQPQTHSPAKWMTCSAPRRLTDATAIKNYAHYPQKQNEKVCFILFYPQTCSLAKCTTCIPSREYTEAMSIKNYVWID